MKYFFIILLFLSSVVRADSQSLEPLDNYISKNGLKDPVARIYVYNRCSALFIMFTVQAKNQKDAESIKFTNNARQAYMTMAVASASSTSDAFKNPDEALKQNQELVKKLEKIYQDYAEKQMDLGKDLFEDRLIGGDTNICSQIYKTLQKK